MKKSIFLFFAAILCASSAWAYTISSAKIYYDDSNSQWGSDVVVAFDKSDGGAVFAMTKIANTNLYYWTGSWGDGAVTYMRFGKTTKTFDWYKWWDNVKNTWDLSTTDNWSGVSNGWGLDINNVSKMFGANSNSSGADLTKTDLTSYSSLNYTQTIKTAVNGADANSKAAITITSYNLTGNSTISSQKSASISTSAKSTTISAAHTATTTLEISELAGDYKFDGWYTAAAGGTKLSGDWKYTYYPTKPTTVYARFSEITCYLMGVGGDWTTGIKMTLNPENNNEFILLDQPINEPIKFKYEETWTADVENYEENDVQWVESGTENYNIVLPAGNYDFYFKKDTKKVYIARNTVVTTTANLSEGGTLTGAGVYNNDDDVTLKATPNTGYDFVNWTKGSEVVSNNATYTFKAAGDIDLVANFKLKTYTVQFLNYDGEVLQSTSVNHGATPEYTGKTPERPADAHYTYTFSGWDNAIAAATSNQTYKAQYSTTINQYTVEATTNPTEGGTVTGAGTYDYGTTITLTATAEEGYEFTGWSDGETANPYTFEVTEDVTLTANFGLKSYTITATAENGTVEGAGVYNHGATVTLTATANEGYKFVNWTQEGEEVSTEVTYTFTATEDAELVANFKATIITLTTGNNDAVIAANIGNTVDVVIERSFTANDGYYTLCVPFNMPASVIGKAYSLGTVTEHVAGEGININLKEENELSAGMPYLVLPKEDMDKLVVEKVTIAEDDIAGQGVSNEERTVNIFFQGYYSAPAAPENQTNGTTQYYVGKNGYLYNEVVDIRGLCGLFTITDEAGNPTPIRARVVAGENVETGVEDIITTDAPVKVIENGQLIIIRDGVKYNVQGVRL